MCIELDELIELGKAMGTTDAKIVSRIIDAQDNILQRQREKAAYFRMKEECGVPAPRTVGRPGDAGVIWGGDGKSRDRWWKSCRLSESSVQLDAGISASHVRDIFVE